MNNLMAALNDYITFRRGLGFKFDYHASALRNFVSFLNNQKAEYISIQRILDWAQQPKNAQPAQRVRRFRIARDFAQYLSIRDLRTEIPPRDLLTGQYQRAPPYIFTKHQIHQLIEQAAKQKSFEKLRPRTYCTLFGLLAITGMRISEIVALDRSDVNLITGIITVRQSKFGKSRFIPIHQSAVEKLHEYGRWRNKLIKFPSAQSFFVSGHGLRLSTGIVRHTFVKLSRIIGLRGVTDSKGPRLHDLRHTFAVTTLANWQRDGITPQQRLPLLSTYLGHVKVSDTYWYLTAVPELMGAVNDRLEKYLGDLT